MCFLFKTLFRTAIIGTALTAAVVGGTAMIVGPERVGAMAQDIQTEIESRLDAATDNPTALRRQIQEAAAEYPARIRTVRADLASLQEESRRLEREQAVSERVVSLIDRDLEMLVPAVEEAASLATSRAQLAAVAFDGDVMSYRRAKAKVKEIERTRVAHVARAADASHNLKYLRSQEDRFVQLLDQLEDEHAQFQAQLVQLQTEVESIARNKRLIEILESRQRSFDEASSFEAKSLEQIRGVLERTHIEQEAELDRLAAGVKALDYEEMAAAELREQVEADAQGAQVLTPAQGR